MPEPAGLADRRRAGDLPLRRRDEIDFDVDLWEVRGQERLDVFCGFLGEIGRRLGKPVLVEPEAATAILCSASTSAPTVLSS